MENIKYRLLGLVVFSVFVLLIYILFKPAEEDIIKEKYSKNKVLSVEIIRRTNSIPKVITSNDSIQILTSLLTESVKAKISSPKGGSDWIDMVIKYENSDADFLRFYKNKLHGNYISGDNHYYKNDSLYKIIHKFSE